MRFKKTILFASILLITFLTYFFLADNKIRYVVLGDSLAAGQNPYGVVSGYGYADYLSDYLEENDQLKEYVKDYAVSGYTTSDILEDLKINREVKTDGRRINLRSVLRESDLVSISIGANDFIQAFNFKELKFEDISLYKKKIDLIMADIDRVLNEVRKYAKEEVVVIGYYNPFPFLFSSHEEELDSLFSYLDLSYEQVCSRYNIKYVSVYEEFKNNSVFLPNPFDIHPNIQGYKAICECIKEQLFIKN